jgi:hypothetical protein
VGVKFFEPPIPGAAAVPMDPPGAAPANPSKFDYTHLGPEGAAACSKIVVEELAKAVPTLARNLVPQ